MSSYHNKSYALSFLRQKSEILFKIMKIMTFPPHFIKIMTLKAQFRSRYKTNLDWG